MSGTSVAAVPRLLLGSTSLPLGEATYVMGVVNASPDSRNIASVASTPEEALAMANRYRDAGATIIDLGGQSSHYDNPTIGADEELGRLLPVLELLIADEFLVSVDTWKPEVAHHALQAGAVMINDTGGLQDPGMRRVLSAHEATGVLMYVEAAHPHAVGEITVSEDKVDAIAHWLQERIVTLSSDGITDLVVDPGIAINYRGDYQAYTRMQLQVIRGLERIKRLGRPVLVPVPRKAEDHRVAAYITLAVEHGADLIRVHDVEWACDLVRLLGRAPEAGR